MDGLRHFVGRAAAILDRENENGAEDEHRHHDAHHGQVDIQVIYVGGDGRRGLRPKWKLHRLGGPPGVGVPAPLPPEHDEHKAEEHKSGGRAEYPDHARDGQSVFSRRRIVLAAEQQHLVGQVADLVGRSVHQTEAEIARVIGDPVEVVRDLAFGRQIT